MRSSGAEFGKQGGLQNRFAVNFLHRDSAGHAPRNRIAQSVHDKPHTVLAKESEGASAAREVGDGLGVVKHNQCPSTTSKTSTIIGPRQAGTVGIGGVGGGENHDATWRRGAFDTAQAVHHGGRGELRSSQGVDKVAAGGLAGFLKPGENLVGEGEPTDGVFGNHAATSDHAVAFQPCFTVGDGAVGGVGGGGDSQRPAPQHVGRCGVAARGAETGAPPAKSAAHGASFRAVRGLS